MTMPTLGKLILAYWTMLSVLVGWEVIVEHKAGGAFMLGVAWAGAHAAIFKLATVLHTPPESGPEPANKIENS